MFRYYYSQPFPVSVSPYHRNTESGKSKFLLIYFVGNTLSTSAQGRQMMRFLNCGALAETAMNENDSPGITFLINCNGIYGEWESYIIGVPMPPMPVIRSLSDGASPTLGR